MSTFGAMGFVKEVPASQAGSQLLKSPWASPWQHSERGWEASHDAVCAVQWPRVSRG